MKKIKLLLSVAFIASLTSCVNGDDYGTPEFECVSITKTKEVADVTNTATAAAKPYTTDETVVDYIEAYVTSSDEGGNFYKSISMMSLDGLKGFSMPVDSYNLYTEYEPGRKVTIKLDKNVYYNKQHGSTVIGASFNGGVGRLSGIQYQDVILRSCEKVDENTIVKNLTIAQAKNDANLNMLIEFDGVQFTDASVGKSYYDTALPSFGGATNHKLRDVAGNTIIVRFSEFATFATKKIPTGNGKLRGVLTKFGSDYQFMVRTENDVNLNGTRLDLTFLQSVNEPFTPYAANASAFDNYYNVATAGSYLWQVKSFGGNKYIQMTANNSGGDNRALFVVPVNFNNVSAMSFKTNDGYDNGAVLKVYYSFDYNTGNPAAATLTDITSNFTISSGHPTSYGPGFINSGTYNFPGLNGTGYIVFEYVGNGNGVKTTMQIDDILIN